MPSTKVVECLTLSLNLRKQFSIKIASKSGGRYGEKFP